MDNYQAVYDAVRSKTGYIDGSQIVERVIANSDFSYLIAPAIESIACEHERPAAIFRPMLSVDGNQWCALYGDNLQDGVAGFGDSPSLAMVDFDKNWLAKLGEA